METRDFTPKETEYNGLKFRSRLEARWAVFFDERGIKYEYEPEGFDLKNGTSYLPDFYLPDFGYYVEVKGKNDHLFEDIEKVEAFVEKSKKAVVFLSVVPYSKESKGHYLFPAVYYSSRWGDPIDRGYCFFLSHPDKCVIIDDWYICHRHKGMPMWRIFPQKKSARPLSEEIDLQYERLQAVCGETLPDDFGEIRDDFDFSPIQLSMLKARKARFEFGECVTPEKKDNNNE